MNGNEPASVIHQFQAATQIETKCITITLENRSPGNRGLLPNVYKNYLTWSMQNTVRYDSMPGGWQTADTSIWNISSSPIRCAPQTLNQPETIEKYQ